jgi:hypothetical protein
MKEELDGCFNEQVDLVKRNDETWSDTNMTDVNQLDKEFVRLKCRNCNGLSFEVLQVASYQTAAKCINCNMYYLAHCG